MSRILKQTDVEREKDQNIEQYLHGLKYTRKPLHVLKQDHA